MGGDEQVAELLGIGSGETVGKWLRQSEIDAGARAGTSSQESAEVKRLKRENAQLVLDALEQAIWTRGRAGSDLESVVVHSDRGSQYAAIKYGERLADAGIAASVGSIGDSYDNALAETINGLDKTELIKPWGPRKTADEVEYGTAEWVDWFNHRRLYEYCGEIPPAELETAYYAQNSRTPPAEVAHQ